MNKQKVAVLVLVGVLLLCGVFWGGMALGKSGQAAEPAVSTITAPASISVPTSTPTSTLESKSPVVNVYNNFTMEQKVGGMEGSQSSSLLPPPTCGTDCKMFGVERSGWFRVVITPSWAKVIIEGQEVGNGQVIYLARGWHPYYYLSSGTGLSIQLADDP
ncbi:MAG: hypothetical protein ABIB55_01865 [Candidatus Nealsonbacteria bacterium]